MKEKFKTIKFKDATIATIVQMTREINTLRDAGYTLTVRQLYYRLVATDSFPDERTFSWTGSKWVRDPNGTKNAQPNYKWMQGILNDARLAGLVDWSAIEDRTRNLKSYATWRSPADAIQDAADRYSMNLWEPEFGQTHRPEVWVEKDALMGVVEKACGTLGIPHFSTRGYTAQSEAYDAANRLMRYKRKGQTPVIIHLGDHDPSGIDMSRDILERIEMFRPLAGTEVRRVALNMDQVRLYNPPPNPAKETDSRFAGYQSVHGDESWELDALTPQVIDALISAEVDTFRDVEAWDKAAEQETEGRQRMAEVSDEWDTVKELVEGMTDGDLPGIADEWEDVKGLLVAIQSSQIREFCERLIDRRA